MRMFAVLAVVSFMTVGCAGASKQQVTDLESSLAACESEKGTLASERDRLQTELAAAQQFVDRANALAAARKQNLDDLTARLQELVAAGSLDIEVRNGVIVLQLPNAVLFDSGKADVKKDARATLNQVAKALEPIQDRRFYIAGHTDNAPVKEKAKKFSSNWELSTLRALKVQEILLAAGLREERTVVAGFGETDPVASNDSPEGMLENRRIEIMLIPNLDALMPELAAMAAAAKAKPAAGAEVNEAGEASE